jgi:glycosyltransferase involved in cell wall biosynthesis
MHCEILIPAYSDLSTLSDCISSLIEHTRDTSIRIAPIAPLETERVTAFFDNRGIGLAAIVFEEKAIDDFGAWLCQRFEQSDARYLILMRHDTLVGDSFLERLWEALAAQPNASMVTPLSNHFTPYRLPLIPGTDAATLDRLVQQHGRRNFPLVRQAGAILAIDRTRFPLKVMEPAFRGQFNYSIAKHLKSQETRVALADHVYCFQAAGSHVEAEPEWQAWLTRLLGQKVRKLQRPELPNRDVVPLEAANLFDQKAPLALRNAARETARRLKKALLRGQPNELIKTLVQAPKNLSQRQEYRATDQLGTQQEGGGLRILYLLEKMVVSGGVFSVVQLVNELILQGQQARIAYIDRAFETYGWKMLQRPLQFASREALIDQAPEVDLVVATHWHTASWAAEMVAKGRAKNAAYFVQDYEAWYYPESEFAIRDAVRRSYEAIPHRIVKSSWLQNLLEEDGYPARKISFGLDIGIFYPRPIQEKSGLTLLAMARPSTPWRGFQNVINTLSRVYEAHPEVKIVLFGHDYLTSKRIPFPFLDMGVIDDYEVLAELYSRADIFFEGSDFQGFGRLTLEAMACETACVLTDVGGVGEYANPEENCLTVPPRTPELAAKAIIRLIEEPELRARFARKAGETALSFDHKLEAEATLDFFREISRKG